MLVRKRRRAKAVKTRGEGKTKKNKSWMPGQKGQGREDPSHVSEEVANNANRDRDYSPALPSRERIAKVLR